MLLNGQKQYVENYAIFCVKRRKTKNKSIYTYTCIHIHILYINTEMIKERNNSDGV